MIEIKGRYNRAVVYTDELEDNAAGQIRTLCDQSFTRGAQIRMMPDVHAGAGCVIGTTMTISDKIVPNLVGVDIGCGMETIMLEERRADYPRLDSLIRQRIPAGMTVRETPHAYADEIDLSELRCGAKLRLERGYLSIGTLGGGNHFIEVDQDEEGRLYLVIHSGSRHLGLEVANYYQRAAWAQCNGRSQPQKQALIQELKAQGRQKEIQQRLQELELDVADPPYSLAYVSGELFDDYLHDMALMQRFADLNRQAMAREILRGMHWQEAERFTTVHNYIDTEKMLLRKGAVSAEAGQRLLIPINMRDGSLICQGRGNAEWNCSAPHGAGRLMSRTEARHSFTVHQFKQQMSNVFSTTVSQETLDECPMAYKSMEHIVAHIGPTAEIQLIIKPAYNFKAGEE